MGEAAKFEPKILTLDQAKELSRLVSDRAAALNAAIGHAIAAGLDVEIEIIDTTRIDGSSPQPMVQPLCRVLPHRIV